MFFLDVQNEGMLGMEKAQRAIALVAFGNKIIAARIPVRDRLKNRNFGANVMRLMYPTLAQNVGCHCRGCCFAVHSGDNNAALCGHDRSQSFRATEDRFSRVTPAYENLIIVCNCGGKNNKIGCVSMLPAMLFVKAQSEPLQSIYFHRADLV